MYCSFAGLDDCPYTVCRVSVYKCSVCVGLRGEGGVWALLDPPVPNKNRYNSVNIRNWWAQKGPREGGGGEYVGLSSACSSSTLTVK